MNKPLFCAIAAIFASAAAFAQTKQMTDAERRKIEQDNNHKQEQIARELGSLRYGSKDKPKTEAAIAGNVTAMTELLGEKSVVPATRYDLGKINHLAATAYANPVNLHFYGKAKNHYLESIRLATSPDEKALRLYEYASYMLECAQEETREHWEKAMLEAYNTQGAAAATRLRMLEKSVPGLDLDKDGAALAGTDPSLQAVHLESCIKRIVKTHRESPAKALDRKYSYEHGLELCENVLKNPGLKGRDYFVARRCKLQMLEKLEMYDEQERCILEWTTACQPGPEMGDAFFTLGEFYLARSRRYYMDPNPALLKKAIAAYGMAIANDPGRHYYIRKSIEALFLLKDYPAAILQVDKYVDTLRDKKPDPYALMSYGDAHYYMGDYAKACEFYGRFDSGDKAFQRRYAESLYATGRLDDAIKHIGRMYNSWSHAEANQYFIRKIEEQKKQMEQ